MAFMHNKFKVFVDVSEMVLRVVMDWLLNEHHILQGVYYARPDEEKLLIWMLFEKAMDRRG